MTDRTLLARLTLRGALRVPEITVYFWVVKALSTGMGESTSDYLVHAMPPVTAVGLGFAYVATRPLGASFADWMGKPTNVGGLGWGDGPVALALTIAIFCVVAYLAITHRDVQRLSSARRVGRHGRHARLPAMEAAMHRVMEPSREGADQRL